jgi:hypothetical protein
MTICHDNQSSDTRLFLSEQGGDTSTHSRGLENLTTQVENNNGIQNITTQRTSTRDIGLRNAHHSKEPTKEIQSKELIISWNPPKDKS